MNQVLLETLLDAHQRSFSQIADAWADHGASAFYLTDATEQVLMQWPPAQKLAVASASAPLTINGRFIGKVHVTGNRKKVAGTLAQLRLMTDARILSDLLQMEYELQRMTTDIIDQQDQLMALHQLAKTSRVHHDLRQTLAELAHVTAQVLKTKYAFVALQHEQQAATYEMYPPQAWPSAIWQSILETAATGHSNQEWLFQQQEDPVNCPHEALQNLLMKRVAVRSDVSLLLGAADKFDGTFQAPDLKVFSTIAGPAAATIENAMLHQEMLDQTRIQTEMDLARQIQLRLLPQRTPLISGISLTAMAKPASQVGGDFFDFIQGGGGILTFTVGDVSGKGMPAALLMAMLRTVMRNKADTADAAKPAELLAQVNTALYQDFSDVDMFATVFIGQYDYQQHLLYYANDGHAPVIFRPAAGHAHLLPADAPPLGVLDFNLAQQHVLAFQPGDLLVITTDGINEAENNCGEMLGYDRLIAAVEALATADVAVIAEELFARATAFAGGAPQADDQTLLVLKRNISQ